MQSTHRAPAHQHAQQNAHPLADLMLLEATQRYRQSQDLALSGIERQEHRRKAAELARLAYQHRPEWSEALNLQGRIALEERRLDEAERLLRSALAQDPQSGGIHYSLGHVLLAKQQLEPAEERFRTAIKLDPSLWRARTSLAYTLKERGEVVAAFDLYRALYREHPEDSHVCSKLFECMSELKVDQYSDALSHELTHYLSASGVDHTLMRRMLNDVLRLRYGLGASQSTPIELSALASDPLLLLALRTLILADQDVETLLMAIRDALLERTLSTGSLDAELVSLAVSLAAQAHLCEYAMYMTEDTQEALGWVGDFLAAQLQEAALNSELIEVPLLIWSMFRPLSDLPGSARLLQRPPAEWSYFMRPLLQQSLQEPAALAARASQVASIGLPCDKTSQRVQAQYEENPYPRWTAMQFHTETDYAQALCNELPGFMPPAYLKANELNVLVAGCGTGRHALHVARYFRHAQVTAVDLSATSLAYAEQMAERYGIHNIRFLQGDILQLNDLGQRFHIIECSGVLHHMADPLLGWQRLATLLVPQGLMKIGLYSTRARQEVKRYREMFPVDPHGLNIDEIRERRHQLMSTPLGQQFPAVLASKDFYSASGCRDLLFNAEEHTFTPLQIMEMCKATEMEFLGFVRLSSASRNAYLSQYPEDTQLRNLAHWDAFEAEHPGMFGGMLQFYCMGQ